MSDHIRLEAIPFVETYNPTPHQRLIYRFYDRKYSDDAKEIYSTEWFNLTRRFRKEASPFPATLRTWDEIKRMDFASFFIAHPVAGFGLWRLLQACYALDKLVCFEKDDVVVEWETWKPFEYLDSSEVEHIWKDCLLSHRAKIDNRSLHGDTLIRWLYDSLCAFDRLETALANLKKNFKENMNGHLAERMANAASLMVWRKAAMFNAELSLSDVDLEV
jgi:hypothetical protein